eukprot:SAG11_NODE_21939_length_415_cov_1.395570_2_plen_30_part_01
MSTSTIDEQRAPKDTNSNQPGSQLAEATNV